MITLEHTSVRSLGCYGNEEVKTPAIDRLAADSTVVSNCTVPCPLCVPSRVAFFSGRYPSATGSRQNEVLINPDEVHLVGLLAQAGYRCGLVGKNHCFTDIEKAGFSYHRPENRGRYGRRTAAAAGTELPPPVKPVDPALIAARQQRYNWSEYPRPLWGGGPLPAAPEEASSYMNVQNALAFLREPGDAPKFLWLSFTDPHPPYRCPPPYDRMYDPSALSVPPLPADESAYPQVLQFYRREGCFDLFDEEQRRQTKAYYYGMLSYVDFCLGLFFDELRRHSLLEQTAILLTGDHGDFMGERGLVRKCGTFYDCLVQVPLILHGWPGIKPGRVDMPVSSLDCMPALLSLAGIDEPPGIQGRNLIHMLQGKLPARRATYGEIGGFTPPSEAAGRGLEGHTFYYGHSRMLRTNRYKYICHLDDEDELYDLAVDPLELENLIHRPELTDVLAELRYQMLLESIKAEDPLDWRLISR